ncbi:cupin domain-containing protein [Streptomyces sp. 7N604]|uniref:cupin domain-containing protein n=1 Tax=Streptomyces sp. 7N604 TaxID=3457415 RepID=UPI003FD4327D
MTYPEPRYLGEDGQITATYRPADSPSDAITDNGDSLRYLATRTSTSGEFGFYRLDLGPGPYGAGPHFHRTVSESFFILSGTMRLFDGKQWIDATSGDFLHVPVGGVHGFRNESGDLASMLVLFAPGADREAYFEGLPELGALSEEEQRKFHIRHDSHLVEPG